LGCSMLRELTIQHIVLIEKLHLTFADGLCVLTGETGAGKSILLDALGLTLGERAQAGMVRSGQAQGSVSAVFDIAGNVHAQAALEQLGMEPADELILRRTIASDGKSKAFVNDAPVGQQALKTMAACLLEIHGQHDQQGLLDVATHRTMLDAFGKLESECKDVATAYAALSAARKKQEALEAEIAQAQKEEEYLRHMHGELKTLAPKAGEEESLAEKRTRLQQSEKLRGVLDEAMQSLSGKDVVGSLRAAHRTLTRSLLTQGEAFAAVIASLETALDGADSAMDQLLAIHRESFGGEDVLERTEERLFALRAAARKYGVACEELASLFADVTHKLSLLKSNESALGEASKAVAACKKRFVEVAEDLSKKRKAAAKKLEKAVLKELASLKMENTHVEAAFSPLAESEWASHGADGVQFMVATNVAKGAAPTLSPIHKIASGGELSRFMLALKVAFAHVRITPSLIFDEIDTGTGGAVADAIGKRLALLAAHHQVFVVTHLPQVAARGNQHLRVEKNVGKNGVTTRVSELTKQERTEELARMLSGAKITDEARKAAKKLMEDAA
jgi:DNA repair protein RecN (Recombination protein N)